MCIGRFFIEVILKVSILTFFSACSCMFVYSLQEWLKRLMETHKWHLVEDQDLTYKTLPVSRPRADLKFIFSTSEE